MPDSDTTDESVDTASDTETTDASKPTSSDTPNGGRNDWKAQYEKTQADLAAAKAEADKWREMSRKHEGRAKENAAAASKAKTVEEQLADLQQRLADRDALDQKASVDRAVESLTARMVRAGMSDTDAAEFAADIDPHRLMTDGKPDPKAIDAIAARLAKVAGRPTPDPDQGRKNGSAPADMNTLIRQAAGR